MDFFRFAASSRLFGFTGSGMVDDHILLRDRVGAYFPKLELCLCEQMSYSRRHLDSRLHLEMKAYKYMLFRLRSIGGLVMVIVRSYNGPVVQSCSIRGTMSPYYVHWLWIFGQCSLPWGHDFSSSCCWHLSRQQLNKVVRTDYCCYSDFQSFLQTSDRFLHLSNAPKASYILHFVNVIAQDSAFPSIFLLS